MRHILQVRLGVSFLDLTTSFQLAPSPNYLGQIHSVSLNTHQALITHITRNLPFIISDIRDEMVSAFNDAMATANSQNTAGTGFYLSSSPWSWLKSSFLLLICSGWMEFNTFELISQVINRINNRVLVGLPLCTCIHLFSFFFLLSNSCSFIIVRSRSKFLL